MENLETTETEAAAIIETLDSAPVATVTEFKIVMDGKRTMKKSVSGQVIEALKRATSPLALNALTQRVKSTKVGKDLEVKDLKARVRKCAEWYANDENGWVEKTEKGEYALTRV